MKVKLTITYDGTNFCGWQVQPKKRTVQGEIQKALKNLTKEGIKIVGSGRTDSGVHAEGQVAEFTTSSKVPAEKFAPALNAMLPSDVKILKSQKAKDSFCAIKGAKKKTYTYRFYKSQTELPLKERFAVRLEKDLDVTSIKECAKLLEGEHDFKAFSSSGGSAKTSVRTIYKIAIKNTKQELCFSITGNGFLYNMVRIIVGTLIKVGEKKATIKDVEKMLSTKNRELGGRTLPAKGLTLTKVQYDK